VLDENAVIAAVNRMWSARATFRHLSGGRKNTSDKA
jgi:hypothetical protein